MDAEQLIILGAPVIASSLDGRAIADGGPEPYVRVAEIEVDPIQLELYTAAAREVVEASVRMEPGVFGSLFRIRQGQSGPYHGVRDLRGQDCL
jgi:hypothetical protein